MFQKFIFKEEYVYYVYTYTIMLHYGKENKSKNEILKEESKDIEKAKFIRNKAINFGNHLLEK